MSTTGEAERHVKFDEVTIQEHDKLRGTRQKIDEPKTPFHRDSLDGSEEEGSFLPAASAPTLNFGELQSKLEKVDQEGTEPEAAVNAKHDEFEAKRKQHYNEYEMLRRWREQHEEEEEEEDEEEEDDDEGSGAKESATSQPDHGKTEQDQ